MKNTAHSKTLAVYGSLWAENTKRFIEKIRLFDRVYVFKYDCRESLFIDQYDFFIITDFNLDSRSFWNDSDLKKLDEMRQVIYTRSMKSVVFANIDDVNVAKSLREASARVVEVKTKQKPIPNAFAEALLYEYFSPQDPETRVLHRGATRFIPALKTA